MVNCVCGEKKKKPIKKPYYIVKATGETVLAKGLLSLACCASCGVERLAKFPYEAAEAAREYFKNYPPTTNAYAVKGYEHDRELAGVRIKSYGISSGERLLDVGSGSGAFVDECRSRDVEAYGCEACEYSDAESIEHIYPKMLEDIHFPTDHFDRVTCHDVLEHSVNPLETLKEIRRILKVGGHFNLDFPDFFDKDGAHHWKKEHLWFFSRVQLEELLSQAGFEVTGSVKPIESKIVFYAVKKQQERISVLLPPGTGDIYWSLVKLQSFLDRESIEAPVDAYIASPKAKTFDSHKRSFPYLQMFPFLHSMNDVKFNDRDGIWKEAYLEQGRSIFKNVLDCDYFITWNGHLRAGKTLEEVDSDLVCNWDLPRFISLAEERYREAAIEAHGDYIVLYFSFAGTNGSIFKHFPLQQIFEALKRIIGATGFTPVFVGAAWDAECPHQRKLKRLFEKDEIDFVDLVGETTIEQVFGLMRGAQGVWGTPSGITIMAGAFGVKTIMLIHDYLTTGGVDKRFSLNICPPETLWETYFPLFAEDVNFEGLCEYSISILKGGGMKKQDQFTRDANDIHELKPSGRSPRQVSVRDIQEGPPKRIRNRAKAMEQGRKDRQRKQVRLRNVEAVISPDQGMDYAGVDVVCVCRTGDKFIENHVKILRDSIERNTALSYTFKVFTNSDIKGAECIKLKLNMPGWWSKVEIFKSKGPTLYIDLDTAITGDLDNLLKHVSAMPAGEFRMLTPFNRRRQARGLWASGVMAWHGDFAFLFRKLDKFYRNQFKGDQDYITHMMDRNGKEIKPIDDWVRIASFKRDCLDEAGVADVDIACFHGTPFPSDVLDIDWVGANWRTGQ